MNGTSARFLRLGVSLSSADGKRAPAAVHRHLAALRCDERCALDPAQGPDDLHLLLSRFKLLALSRPGLHGRQHARPVVSGLREVFCPNRSSLRQYARQEKRRDKPGEGEFSPDSSPASFRRHFRCECDRMTWTWRR
jgi:hypothetical protein